MSDPASIASRAFLQGFSISAAIFAVLSAALYLRHRFRPKKPADRAPASPLPRWLNYAERLAAGNPEPSKTAMGFRFMLGSVLGVSAAAPVLALAVYAWTIGVGAYDGTVERKHSGKGYRLQIAVYDITVEGTRHTIGESLYNRVREGDMVRRPFSAPWTYVNGRPQVYSLALEVFGAFCGLLAVVAVVVDILIVLSYRDSLSGPSASPSRAAQRNGH